MKQANCMHRNIFHKLISQIFFMFDTLNLEATEENLYDDLEDSSGSEGKSPEIKGHFDEDKRLQCSTMT